MGKELSAWKTAKSEAEKTIGKTGKAARFFPFLSPRCALHRQESPALPKPLMTSRAVARPIG
jgi:hypothetical protein